MRHPPRAAHVRLSEWLIGQNDVRSSRYCNASITTQTLYLYPHLYLSRGPVSAIGDDSSPLSPLRRVDEVRPIVAHDPDLLLRLPLQHVVPRARQPLLVLALQHEVHEDAAAEQADDLVGEHDAVARPVARLLFGEEDVAGDDACGTLLVWVGTRDVANTYR